MMFLRRGYDDVEFDGGNPAPLQMRRLQLDAAKVQLPDFFDKIVDLQPGADECAERHIPAHTPHGIKVGNSHQAESFKANSNLQNFFQIGKEPFRRSGVSADEGKRFSSRLAAAARVLEESPKVRVEIVLIATDECRAFANELDRFLRVFMRGSEENGNPVRSGLQNIMHAASETPSDVRHG